MDTLTIQIEPALKQFIDAQVAQGSFKNIDEYVSAEVGLENLGCDRRQRWLERTVKIRRYQRWRLKGNKIDTHWNRPGRRLDVVDEYIEECRYNDGVTRDTPRARQREVQEGTEFRSGGGIYAGKDILYRWGHALCYREKACKGISRDIAVKRRITEYLRNKCRGCTAPVCAIRFFWTANPVLTGQRIRN